jgi:NitT/TauT family transport system ATP-binding protein
MNAVGVAPGKEESTSGEERQTIAAPAPLVELRDVCFAYPQGLEVLGGISLPIAAGSIVGVVGPSGCGKSTLLSLIAGLSEPTSGRVERKRLAESSRHPISMVFQKDTLLPWLTAAENVRFFARFRKHHAKRRFGRDRDASRDLDQRAGELLRMAHLDDQSHDYPYQLSGGMRRRLAFLAAVAASPQVLLLDEPFSSVDEPTRIGIHQDVFRIARMLGITTVLVTHDLAEAISLCDEVVILTKKPARIAQVKRIPFGDDRQMLELREKPEFLELYGELWHELRAQIVARPQEGVVESVS